MAPAEGKEKSLRHVAAMSSPGFMRAFQQHGVLRPMCGCLLPWMRKPPSGAKAFVPSLLTATGKQCKKYSGTWNYRAPSPQAPSHHLQTSLRINL